jgi:hypothetical protein
MSQMSPLAALLLRLMRLGCMVSAGFTGLVIAIEIWKRWNFGGLAAMNRPDYAFLAVLVLMLGGFLWLARSIGRELARGRPLNPDG